MGAVTNVILITGFLGSGKTTFLNRVVKVFPKDQKLMILMNEFGEIGLDGTLLEGEELDILEISKGSIFCVCVKTDFIKALNEIAYDLKPDVLIVESTGVANPSDLKKDLNLSIFKGRFQMKEQICIIDADCFKDAYQTFVSVEKQIESSTLFIINKVDLVSDDIILDIKSIVTSHNKNPEFYETSYSEVPMDRFFVDKSGESEESKGDTKVSLEELETTIEKILENPDANATPPDRLMSAVYTWQGSDLETFKSIMAQLPKNLIRAKGVLSFGTINYLFNLVMSRQTVEEYTPVKDCTSLINNLVFIGPPEALTSLETISRKHSCFVKKSVFDPMKNN